MILAIYVQPVISNLRRKTSAREIARKIEAKTSAREPEAENQSMKKEWAPNSN